MSDDDEQLANYDDAGPMVLHVIPEKQPGRIIEHGDTIENLLKHQHELGVDSNQKVSNFFSSGDSFLQHEKEILDASDSLNLEVYIQKKLQACNKLNENNPNKKIQSPPKKATNLQIFDISIKNKSKLPEKSASKSPIRSRASERILRSPIKTKQEIMNTNTQTSESKSNRTSRDSSPIKQKIVPKNIQPMRSSFGKSPIHVPPKISPPEIKNSLTHIDLSLIKMKNLISSTVMTVIKNRVKPSDTLVCAIDSLFCLLVGTYTKLKTNYFESSKDWHSLKNLIVPVLLSNIFINIKKHLESDIKMINITKAEEAIKKFEKFIVDEKGNQNLKYAQDLIEYVKIAISVWTELHSNIRIDHPENMNPPNSANEQGKNVIVQGEISNNNVGNNHLNEEMLTPNEGKDSEINEAQFFHQTSFGPCDSELENLGSFSLAKSAESSLSRNILKNPEDFFEQNGTNDKNCCSQLKGNNLNVLTNDYSKENEELVVDKPYFGEKNDQDESLHYNQSNLCIAEPRFGGEIEEEHKKMDENILIFDKDNNSITKTHKSNEKFESSYGMSISESNDKDVASAFQNSSSNVSSLMNSAKIDSLNLPSDELQHKRSSSHSEYDSKNTKPSAIKELNHLAGSQKIEKNRILQPTSQIEDLKKLISNHVSYKSINLLRKITKPTPLIHSALSSLIFLLAGHDGGIKDFVLQENSLEWHYIQNVMKSGKICETMATMGEKIKNNKIFHENICRAIKEVHAFEDLSKKLKDESQPSFFAECLRIVEYIKLCDNLYQLAVPTNQKQVIKRGSNKTQQIDSAEKCNNKTSTNTTKKKPSSNRPNPISEITFGWISQGSIPAENVNHYINEKVKNLNNKITLLQASPQRNSSKKKLDTGKKCTSPDKELMKNKNDIAKNEKNKVLLSYIQKKKAYDLNKIFYK